MPSNTTPTPLVFLSSPYTHPDKRIKELRIQRLLTVDAHLMRQGVYTISPLYKHLLVQSDNSIPSDWEYWSGYCRALLLRCSSLLVVPSDGWQTSVGVREEMEMAHELGVPCSVFDLDLLR